MWLPTEDVIGTSSQARYCPSQPGDTVWSLYSDNVSEKPMDKISIGVILRLPEAEPKFDKR